MFIRRKVICVFAENGRYWFTRHLYFNSSDYYLIPPGGGIEAGEDATQAVIREVWEELGLTISDPTFIGMLENEFFWEAGNELCHETIYCYRINNHEGKYNLPNTAIETTGAVFPLSLLSKDQLIASQLAVFPEGLIDLLE